MVKDIDIKRLFEVYDSNYIQTQKLITWEWTFQSSLSSHVQVKVTTYGLHTDSESKKEAEREAWRELEKVMLM